MGAWNYGKSQCVCTLAYKDVDYYEYEHIDEIEELMEEYGASYDYAADFVEQRFYDNISLTKQDVERMFKGVNLEYYDVRVESGYYEGFWIDIQRVYYAFDFPLQRIEMQEELTKLIALLDRAIIEYGLRIHYPGYASGWVDTVEASLEELNQYINKEKELITQMPIIK